MHFRGNTSNLKIAQSYPFIFILFSRLGSGIRVVYIVANGYTVKTLQDACEYTLRQCPEVWVSDQEDLLIALASLESLLHDLFLYHLKGLTWTLQKNYGQRISRSVRE